MTELELRLGEPVPTGGGGATTPWTGQPLRLRIDSDVVRSIRGHAAEDTTLECGGVLLGLVDGEGSEVRATAHLRAEGAAQGADNVRFTHETLAELHNARERLHPDLAVVGWYHSHPGFGIFLSERDMFLHRHFYDAPYQIAYVVDPINRRHGVFGWDDGEIVKIAEQGLQAMG